MPGCGKDTVKYLDSRVFLQRGLWHLPPTCGNLLFSECNPQEGALKEANPRSKATHLEAPG